MRWTTMLMLIAGMIVFMTQARAQEADAFEQMRAEMLGRRRRVILNNDGGDAVVAAKAPTAEAMLAARTIGLEDTHVDTIFYCTNRGTFSRHSHNSQVSGSFLGTEGRFANNVLPALIEQGTDPLEVMVGWCREHDREIFWSERMNDQHDSGNPENFSAWKQAHPECLVGSPDNRPPYGSWSQVDYAQPAVRDQMFAIIEEVCRNYDVDGIEMDFFRHPCFFRSTAWGEHASEEETAVMTGFVRRVREMTEAVGRERGRPILVAIRVVDSVEMARAVGLDLETWLDEGLVDIITGSGYFRMNPWRYLAELGHRYGVKVYAGLSDSRVQADTAPFSRRSQESYRARAASAWQAGVDGIYIFNMFNPRSGFLREIGEPEVLAGLSKTYFATVRGATSRSYGNPDFWIDGGSQWRNVPVLTPETPLSLAPGERVSVPLFVGDDLAAVRADGRSPVATCHIMTGSSERLSVLLNGPELTERRPEEPWLSFPLSVEDLRPGENTFEFVAAATPAGAEAAAPSVEWTAEALPATPWRHLAFRPGAAFAELQDGALLVADRGEAAGDFIYFTHSWGAKPDAPAEVEAVVRVLDGWNNITVSNGVATERVGLYPDRIETYHSDLIYPMDTTGDFHTYRVRVQGADIRVYVDGELCIDGRGAFVQPADGRNDAAFGAANSPSRGEALWRSVRLTSPGLAGAQVYDLLVSITFPAAE